ncbi:MAG: SUMF1/EgtB/PvdO family nonheme iron enzyme [Microcoleus vaginatus WJT46-NPBG5]|jgi:formylglycine-generating enzyme required for sulfatase activity/energy-coupling factor transporter ATP-binding protein EcfA2|nr:SUMF1/EgtB/PvdO family nonheme iron enzyme [Microcoleus vaginatus WJT46-NPBG5]
MAAPLESSVVRIYSKSGKVVGAGFLVSSKYILTCAHVVNDALGIARNTQEQPDGVINLDFPLLAVEQRFTAKVIFWQPVNPNQKFEDIAGLELETEIPDTAQPAQLVTSEDLWGHPFRVLGFPRGQPNGVSASGVLRGRIANGWVQLEDVKQPGYRLEPGFSGAPVWDEELKGVAGMAVAAEMDTARADVKAAFMIPTSILVNAWSDLGKQAIPSCPYRGLFAFREQDAQFFFGRETFTEQLFAGVQRQQLVAVIGSSGSGKSSVVLAGLIPKLREEGSWLIESFRPNKQPFYELAAALISQLEPELGKTDKTIKAKELAESIRQHGFTADVSAILKDNPGKRLLLVVDQFEELYTGCTDTEQGQFVDASLAAVESASRTITLVLTLRADFYSYIVNYPRFTEALNKYPAQNLSLMQAEEMQAAIELPAQKMGIKLEEGLTERILNDVKQEPGNLPLLEFALTQLWEKQSRGLLTHQAYSEIGGVAKALSNHAEAVYGKLSQGEQKQAQRIFLQLVRPGEGTEDTRRVASRGEVGNWELVTSLAGEEARLVVTGRDEQTGEETVEVVHEVLIREWGQLRGWMKSDRTFRTWQERLRVAMRQWTATNKDDGALLRGVLLTEAQGWCNSRLYEMSQKEQDFIHSSLELQKREKLEKELQHKRELDLERNRRYLAQGLAAVLGTIAISATGVLAYPQVLRWKAASLNPMVDIPAGDIVIGSNASDAEKEEKPERHIHLSAFQIEQFEVSNRQYRLCVEARACSEPTRGLLDYLGDKASDYPVVGITAVQAATYCRWVGRRLPTEVEWERAARGLEAERRLWPWGNQKPTPQLANLLFSGNIAKSSEPVISHLDGRSPEKVYNLVGNVWEWTASYFDRYPNSDQQIWDGQLKTLRFNEALAYRGGSWKTEIKRITDRGQSKGLLASDSIGIRCAN